MKRPAATGINLWLQKLLLLHMLVFGLIPVGYMPAQADDNGFTYIICTPNGLKVLSHLPGEEPQDDPVADDVSNTYCPYFGRDTLDLTNLTISIDEIRSKAVHKVSLSDDPVCEKDLVGAYNCRAPPLKS